MQDRTLNSIISAFDPGKHPQGSDSRSALHAWFSQNPDPRPPLQAIIQFLGKVQHELDGDSDSLGLFTHAQLLQDQFTQLLKAIALLHGNLEDRWPALESVREIQHTKTHVLSFLAFTRELGKQKKARKQDILSIMETARQLSGIYHPGALSLQ